MPRFALPLIATASLLGLSGCYIAPEEPLYGPPPYASSRVYVEPAYVAPRPAVIFAPPYYNYHRHRGYHRHW